MKRVDWSGVVGHGKITKLLDAYCQKGVVPHSMIFCGSSGVGKKMVARRLAKTLVCQADIGTYCNNCFACKSWRDDCDGDNPFVFVGRDKIYIESIRFLKKELGRSNLLRGYRVVLIDDMERMTKEAANAILKLMEEPKNRIVFIGITSQIGSVLDTIVSRSTILHFDRLSREEALAVARQKYAGHNEDSVVNMMMGQPGLFEKYAKVDRAVLLKNAVAFWQLYYASYSVKVAYLNKISKIAPNKMFGLLGFWETCLRDYLLWKKDVTCYRWWQSREVDSIYSKMNLKSSVVVSLLDSISFFRDNMNRGLNKKLQLSDILINNS